MFIASDLPQYGPEPFGPVEFKFMVRGFFDDSGKESDPSNRIVCMAGYVATEMILGPFHEHWAQLLMKYNMSWLHMTDFMQDADEYAGRGWGWPEKKQILETFAMCIKVYHLIGFGVAVDAEAWAELPKELRGFAGDAQSFCFSRMLKMLSDRMNKSRPDDFMTITFDCDVNFTPGRFQRFIKIREYFPAGRKNFRAMTIADPKTFLPLQAADFLAWETRKDLLRQMGGFETRPEFQTLFLTMPSFPPDYTHEFWDRASLQRDVVGGFSEVKQRISELRQDDAPSSERPARGDQSETGRGEGGEKAEES